MVGPLPWHARRGVHEEVREGEGKKARHRSTRIEKEEEGERGTESVEGSDEDVYSAQRRRCCAPTAVRRNSVITMASVKDTATFFAEGTASQFEHVLKLYPQALRLKADRKTKKPEELIKLDNW